MALPRTRLFEPIQMNENDTNVQITTLIKKMCDCEWECLYEKYQTKVVCKMVAGMR